MKTEDNITKFKAVAAQQDFAALESRIRKYWGEADVVAQYLRRNAASKRRFSFIDGPITANNRMGVHHAWGRTYKDAFQRFRNMQGYKQRFQNGFDGQGLWVEVEVEKELGFNSKRDIESYGVDEFVNACKARVEKYSAIITEQSQLLGYFMDWANSYHTMSDANNYAIWAFLKHCRAKGWLYEGDDVMPWCPRCATGLSQHEIITDGYREVEHASVFVRSPLLKDGKRTGEDLLFWTTTPWTIPANVMSAVHPEERYVKALNRWETSKGTESATLWLAKGCLSVLKGKYEILDEIAGADMEGWTYEAPFDHLPAQAEARKAHRVILWDGVSSAEGAGIVHMAPGAGSDDYKLGVENKLPIVKAVDDEGKYFDGFDFLSRRYVGDVTQEIIDFLRKSGLHYRTLKYKHRYPVCWRCGTELVFRLVAEWFISMDTLRPAMMEATKQIKWTPSFGKERELDWLLNMGDWMISKKRYWGLALPIFKCGECSHVDVIGSRDELRERAVAGWDEFADKSPHRPWIDAVAIACAQCGAEVRRIKDVGNPWLDAGIAPLSTLSPDAGENSLDDWFPADWISESFPGQFRNWFYSLIAMSVALKQKRPTNAIFSYALMRDERGEEMHKSRGNAIPFENAAAEIGVDVMRWLFVKQPPANNMNFGPRPCAEVRRQFIIPIWNVYSFFVTYANLDGWRPTDSDVETAQLSELDKWVLVELRDLIIKVTDDMENWRIERAARRIESFVDNLSNWYVRRSRRRFWKSQHDADKSAAYAALYECLTQLTKLLAPFVPFLAEELYLNLVKTHNPDAPPSAHLQDWPTARPLNDQDKDLLSAMRLIVRLVDMGRIARGRADIKIRQPLKRMLIKVANADEANIFSRGAANLQTIIKEELNIHQIERLDESKVRELNKISMKLNFPRLGPRYGKRLNELQKLVANAAPEQYINWQEELDANGAIALADDVKLEREDLLIQHEEAPGYAVVSDAGYTVALDTAVTPELLHAGWAREVVHQIQNLRKSSQLNVSDRINLYMRAGDEVQRALSAHQVYILNETLALSLQYCADIPDGFGVTNCQLSQDASITIGLEKIVS